MGKYLLAIALGILASSCVGEPIPAKSLKGKVVVDIRRSEDTSIDYNSVWIKNEKTGKSVHYRVLKIDSDGWHIKDTIK